MSGTSMGESFISHDELLERVQGQLVSNAAMAARLPPTTISPVHPAEYYAVYEHGGLMAELQAQLGPPAPDLKNSFNRPAAVPDVPDLHTSLNPKTFT